jgi:4-hydroxy 2-oxovalerate aldolase
MKEFKILDCTIRDGGYYTNWDFDAQLIEKYIKSMNALPIDYLEVGYRSPKLEGYYGEYYYCPDYVLQKLKLFSNKKLVIILNEKDVNIGIVNDLLMPCVGIISMVRIAIDPENLIRAIDLAKCIKTMGFEVGFNVMYMSKWKQQPNFLASLKNVEGVADYFYMVDSYGGVYPEDIKEIYNIVRSQISTKIGFHGHNNLELGLINSITALQCGADIVDVTITGMGRGAGNLKTELLLTSLNQRIGLEVDFNALSTITDSFIELQKNHEWGTNLPYMVSGANSLPQKDVMDWVGKRYYSINSIIRALYHQKSNSKEDEKYLNFENNRRFKEVLIVGGGRSILFHQVSILNFIKKRQDLCIIHASSRNAGVFKGKKLTQYFCLLGNEGLRLEKVFEGLGEFDGECVLPPSPRKMGTYVPQAIAEKVRELAKITFTEKLKDTHTTLALQTAIDLGAESIYVVGYDGYEGDNLGQKELELLSENELLFENFTNFTNLELTSLTSTKYKNLRKESIYSY